MRSSGGQSTGADEDYIAATCRYLDGLSCSGDADLEECASTVQEAVQLASELGCRAEVDAAYRCALDEPSVTCNGDELEVHLTCSTERQALENCGRRHPDYCTLTFGAGSDGECWCQACPCNEQCILDRERVFECIETNCEDDACADGCLETFGGAFAEYSACATPLVGTCLSGG